ncbi:hypothetical protein JX265_009359 [Neoarthrinium moseri]|uniref:Heterokaryon incompatibility domain-containing protein n=1 Tax=Neoarthrinium moseri TaxID=1658444 RepID=A0A9P9WGE7_9PEZI|nr:hypothetical protein JX265_009359 [Neoarthrinium moseri]
MAFRLVDTATLRMRRFTAANVPKYGILSHTWVDGEEVNFQEMTQIVDSPGHPARQRSGYNKIVRTCEAARDQALGYVWIDTCCIDKSSSAELSEAINSMFQWYQKADLCFAFLSDLEPYAYLPDVLDQCRWFTRGWCLQELLAPRDIVFLNSAWQTVGSKIELSRLLSGITNIDTGILADGRLIYNCPVAQRMSWASKRKTTRTEDMAYCLLGIFDVNMPLLYGEGSKAFLRLQEEIIKRSNDMSIFAYAPPSEESALRFPRFECYEIDEPPEENQYCDLFANSPRLFDSCKKLVRWDTELVPSQSFTLTNNGLYFRAASFEVGGEIEDYRMSLNCGTKGDGTVKTPHYLYLRKIGPGLFVRLRNPTPRRHSSIHRAALQTYSEREEASIVTTITPNILDGLKPDKFRTIQIRFDQALKFRNIIQSVSPRDRWDAAGLQFLTTAGIPFDGHLKVFPSLLGLGPYGTSGGEYFILTCGFRRQFLWENAQFDPVESPWPWVALFSAEQWHDLERKHGERTALLNRRVALKLDEVVKLKVGRQEVVANVQMHPTYKARFRINLRMEHEPIALSDWIQQPLRTALNKF